MPPRCGFFQTSVECSRSHAHVIALRHPSLNPPLQFCLQVCGGGAEKTNQNSAPRAEREKTMPKRVFVRVPFHSPPRALRQAPRHAAHTRLPSLCGRDARSCCCKHQTSERCFASLGKLLFGFDANGELGLPQVNAWGANNCVANNCVKAFPWTKVDSLWPVVRDSACR